MAGQSHIKTPLLFSPSLSQRTGGAYNVYLKVESLQPSGSFKIRGVGRSIQAAFAQRGAKLRVISSSGGNAGLAACTAARIVGVPCTVFCPLSTPDHLVDVFKTEGAMVVRQGTAWDEANALAEAAVAQDPQNAVLIHPFEGDELVRGNATLMHEVYDQLRTEHDLDPDKDLDFVCCVVGGGGLLNGVLTGIIDREEEAKASSMSDFRRPHILAVQCFGADAFSQSLLSDQRVTLPAITSKATSMGARTCSSAVLDTASKYGKDLLHTLVVEDAMAASGSFQFAQDHLLLVELSCGAALVPAYFYDRLHTLLGSSVGDMGIKKNMVIVVCGGRKDRIQDIFGYKAHLSDGTFLRMELDGKPI